MKQGDVGDITWSEKIDELRYNNKEFQDVMEKKHMKWKYLERIEMKTVK